MSVRFARLSAAGWSEARTIASGGDLFANWADFPSLIEEADGDLVAHWLRKNGEGAYAYDVEIARSRDGGVTWDPLGTPHDDGTPTEHGFVSLIPEGAETRAFWLDGRKTHSRDAEGHEGAMTLRTALIGERPGPGTLLDERVCDCCQTSAQATPRGPVVVYRDRTKEEIRDIAAIRKTGSGWSDPSIVHDDGWEVAGCPVNGPALAARGNEMVAVWHTVEGGRARVLASFSKDGGATFGETIETDGDEPPGRVDAVMPARGEAIVSWMARSGEGAVIRLRRVGAGGDLGAPLDLAETEPGRSSGFPRLALAGRVLFVAWTQPLEPSRVRTMILSTDAVPSLESAPAGALEARGWDRETGSLAPDFTGAALDGREISFSDFRGEAVLVNFWATWCAPCREEIPVLAAIDGARHDDSLRVVGVSLDSPESRDRVLEVVEEAKIPYMILLDAEGQAAGRFGVTVLPASFLFDRRGLLVWKRAGLIRKNDAELEAAIEEALRR